MPRFKPVERGLHFLAVDLSQQLHPGSFESTLDYLIDHEIDLKDIEARYKNEQEGALAYDPRVLLKIVLLAYSRGIISSRGMQAACCTDVQFMAISGNSAPCFGTLAEFVSSLGPAIGKIFARVLTICDRQGLIGRQRFAIDGVKLPSNASKAKSGKRKDYLRQADKMEKAVEQILAKQRAADANTSEAARDCKAQRRLERLKAEAAKLRAWLEAHPHDRKSAKGKPRLSNWTDNESAKMPSDKGVIQGYTGVAAVDEKNQIIVEAQAHGTGSEQELLLPLAEAIQPLARGQTVVCADSGYCSEDNLKQLEPQGHRSLHPRQRVPQARRALPRPRAAHQQTRCAVGQKREARPEAQAVPAGRLPGGQRPLPLHLSGRQAPVSQRGQLQHWGAPGHQVQRPPARVQKLSVAGALPTPPSAHPGQTSGDLPGQAPQGAGEGHRAYET
jgi:transposase